MKKLQDKQTMNPKIQIILISPLLQFLQIDNSISKSVSFINPFIILAYCYKTTHVFYLSSL